ncbi:MAG: hypothetical protein IJG13_02285 [Kiritimatiellae bacterium]|nr:hypothetical protein [Kiritimatiellia bacterium]
MRTRRSPQGAPIDIADATITVADSVQYTGSPRTPSVTVVYDGATLVVNTDYFVSYNDNTNLGAATAVITGAGEFTGQVVKTFQIVSGGGSTFDFLIEDAELVGSKSTVWYQNGRLLAANESKIYGGAGLNGFYLNAVECPLDANSEYHVANIASSAAETFAATSPWLHARAMSADGKKVLFAPNDGNKFFRQFAAQPAWSVSGLVEAGDSTSLASVTSGTFYGLGVAFANGGQLLLVGTGSESVGGVWATRVYAFPLSTPYDVTTLSATASSVLALESQGSNILRGIVMDGSGTALLVASGSKVMQFALSTAFDLSTADKVSEKTFDAAFTTMLVLNGGSTLFGMAANGTAYEYNLTA